ncbi:MAG: molybdopterin converting factor [Opitutus sp.]|nr:molybdopterin converting factor [Opitutus sp.]
MFLLQAAPIDVAVCRRLLQRADAGACAIFEGWVRDHHHGRGVQRLEFEAFDDMVRLEGERMVEEIEQRFRGVCVLCVHRVGTLEIGEMAVWIGATSAHRPTAFAACRETIEELKRRLPIWKKEHFADGPAEWVDCTQEQNPTGRCDDYFSRVKNLHEVGPSGLTRLAAARVLVLGAGGLGSAALEGLAGSGVGALTVVDASLVERSNLPRQTLYTEGDIGLPKAAAAAARLRLRNPHVQLAAHTREFVAQNAAALIAGHAVVLDCTDNLATRALALESCRTAGVPLVQATVFGFEGTLDTFLPGAVETGPAYWPAAGPREAGGLPVFTPAVAMLGHLQAGEAIKLLLGLPVPSAAATLLVDLLQLSLTRIARVSS